MPGSSTHISFLILWILCYAISKYLFATWLIFPDVCLNTWFQNLHGSCYIYEFGRWDNILTDSTRDSPPLFFLPQLLVLLVWSLEGSCLLGTGKADLVCWSENLPLNSTLGLLGDEVIFPWLKLLFLAVGHIFTPQWILYELWSYSKQSVFDVKMQYR